MKEIATISLMLVAAALILTTFYLLGGWADHIADHMRRN